jgi:hypothetical protein
MERNSGSASPQPAPSLTFEPEEECSVDRVMELVRDAVASSPAANSPVPTPEAALRAVLMNFDKSRVRQVLVLLSLDRLRMGMDAMYGGASAEPPSPVAPTPVVSAPSFVVSTATRSTNTELSESLRPSQRTIGTEPPPAPPVKPPPVPCLACVEMRAALLVRTGGNVTADELTTFVFCPAHTLPRHSSN